jgi:Flp pilus assembly protein TadD
MDVSMVHGAVHAAAAATQEQSRASALVQKVLRNPNASEADIRAARAAASDGDSDDGAQQAALASVVGKGAKVDTHA